MRITFNSQYRDAAAGLETATQSLVDAQRQVATGKRVSKPSDDPSAASGAIDERAQLGSVEQYSRAANTVASRLTVVDSVLTAVIQKLTAAQSAGHNALGSTKTPAAREAIAQQLEGMRSSLLDDINTTFHGRYVFAGAESTVKPYTEGVGGVVSAYAGSSTEVQVDIAEGRSVTVDFDGEAMVKGSAAKDMFASLNDLITAVRAGDSDAMQAELTTLDGAFDRATLAQTRVGGAMNTIEGEKLRLQDMKLAGISRLAKLEDADMAEAISGMTRADTAYKAALAAVGTGSRISLMDYLG